MSFNSCSSPSDLRITDMRFVDIDDAPKRCTLLKIMTNQGICGYGEVRDASSKTYALMLKSRRGQIVFLYLFNFNTDVGIGLFLLVFST